MTSSNSKAKTPPTFGTWAKCVTCIHVMQDIELIHTEWAEKLLCEETLSLETAVDLLAIEQRFAFN